MLTLLPGQLLTSIEDSPHQDIFGPGPGYDYLRVALLATRTSEETTLAFPIATDSNPMALTMTGIGPLANTGRLASRRRCSGCSGRSGEEPSGSNGFAAAQSLGQAAPSAGR